MSEQKTQSIWSNPLTPWAVLIGLSLIWGSSFILIKKSLLAFTPNEVGALRVAISTIAILPILVLRFKKQNWKLIPLFFVVGMTGNFLPALLFSNAEVMVDSGVAGVLNSLTPLFTIIIAWLFFRRTFRPTEAIGIFFGFIGAACLILYAQGGTDFQHISYGLLIVLATICYGLSVNVVNHKLDSVNPIDITVMSFCCVGVLAFGYLIGWTEVVNHATEHPDGMTSLLSVTFLALVGTVISTVIFYKLVQETDAIFGSLVAYLIPIIALLWGILDGETLLITHLIGFGLILFGVYLVKKAPSRNT